MTRKTIPEGTKVYSTLARACRYQQRRPGGVQPVFKSPQGMDCAGWVALPSRVNGEDVVWFICKV